MIGQRLSSGVLNIMEVNSPPPRLENPPAFLERSVESRSASVKSEKFDSVLKSTIESASKEREVARATERLKERREALRAATADPKVAAQLTHNYVHNALGYELLDLSDRPNIRYSATGELVTPITKAYFAKISQAMQLQSVHLYQTETSKGSPDIQILEKIFDLHDQLPEKFKDMLGW
jgi:hypothetical protein